VTTALDLARFVAAALPGPDGEPAGRGVLSPAGVRLALTAEPEAEGHWGLGWGLGLLPGGDRLAYHEGANRGWRAGLALLPNRRRASRPRSIQVVVGEVGMTTASQNGKRPRRRRRRVRGRVASRGKCWANKLLLETDERHLLATAHRYNRPA
jgi:Beta-lactamase